MAKILCAFTTPYGALSKTKLPLDVFVLGIDHYPSGYSCIPIGHDRIMVVELSRESISPSSSEEQNLESCIRVEPA